MPPDTETPPDPWRGPQHPGDTSTGADDGTRWIYSPEFNIWNGFDPEEDGLWELSPDEMANDYPEVIAYLRARADQLDPTEEILT